MADTNNTEPMVPPCTEASKNASKFTAPRESTRSDVQDFKYCNANTKPKYILLQWPNLYDSIKDKILDISEEGDLMSEYCNRVSDIGFPVSEHGMKVGEKLEKEYQKRDEECDEEGRLMCVYNERNGCAMREVLEKFLKEFNHDVFKKTISPYTKWGYVEGLVLFLMTADLLSWVGYEDGFVAREMAKMIGVMMLTTYAVIAEHNLFKPGSEINNIGIISLLMLEFLAGDDGRDLYCEWACEVVRLCDVSGIDLGEETREQVLLSKNDISELRKAYQEKVTSYSFGDEDEKDDDAYKTFAKMEDWKPEDDYIENEGFGLAGRHWYR